MSRCKRNLRKRLRSTAATNGKCRRLETPKGRTARTRNRSRRGRERAELPNPGERLPETSPVEGSPGVGLAAGCNVDVSDDIDDRISPAQNHEKFSQARVLPVGVSLVVGAFALPSHRGDAAAAAPPPPPRARPPGPLFVRHDP